MGYRPSVSIGMPVYNGQRYLSVALDSLLAQTHADFELIISDNASNDQTESLCREYAQRDQRVRYIRQTENIGAAGNFNYVFNAAQGDFFKWAAHDDKYAPDYLSEAVAALSDDPSTVLCHSRTVIIDEDGARVSVTNGNGREPLVDPDVRRLNDERATVRFRDLLLKTHWCFEIFGLMRREAAARTPLLGKFYGSDKAMLAHLCLAGRFREIPRELFFRRYHADSSTGIKSAREREAWVGAAAGKMVFPRAKCVAGYASAIHRSNISFGQRCICWGVLGRYSLQWRKWRELAFPVASLEQPLGLMSQPIKQTPQTVPVRAD